MIKDMKKEFVRVRSAKDIVISLSLIALGCVLILLPTGAAVNITGFFLILAGLILALVMKSGYKDQDTGHMYAKKEHYFQQAMNAPISSAIASRPGSVDLSEADKGNAVRLDVYYGKSTGKAYLQLFEYVPYKYEPCSNMYEHELDTVEHLIK